MRGADLQRPFRGVRSAGAAADDVLSRSRAALTKMPVGAFICGPTAALILGIPLPRHLETADVVHVGVVTPHRAPRLAGIAGHKLDVSARQVVSRHGVRVTEPSRTWRDLALHLRLPDLVAAGDFLLHGRRPVCSRLDLEMAVKRAAGGRGVLILRQALPLLDGRAESRRESHLRLLLIEAGLEGIVPNHWVTVRNPTERFRIDIAFPVQRLGIEYQGEYHHGLEQWQKDMRRLSRLRADGWHMVEVSIRDLDDPAELARRIRALLRR